MDTRTPIPRHLPAFPPTNARTNAPTNDPSQASPGVNHRDRLFLLSKPTDFPRCGGWGLLTYYSFEQCHLTGHQLPAIQTQQLFVSWKPTPKIIMLCIASMKHVSFQRCKSFRRERAGTFQGSSIDVQSCRQAVVVFIVRGKCGVQRARANIDSGVLTRGRVWQ